MRWRAGGAAAWSSTTEGGVLASAGRCGWPGARPEGMDTADRFAYPGGVMAQNKLKLDTKLAAENRKARHQFFIEDTLEAGIMLQGSEVKSLRAGQANIAESYASVEDGELWLINSYIPEFAQAKSAAYSHDARRRRKLLVHKRELARLDQAVGREGMTMVPLKLYFDQRGRAKLEIGLAKGKKMADKRETDKKRDWAREKARLLKER